MVSRALDGAGARFRAHHRREADTSRGQVPEAHRPAPGHARNSPLSRQTALQRSLRRPRHHDRGRCGSRSGNRSSFFTIVTLDALMDASESHPRQDGAAKQLVGKWMLVRTESKDDTGQGVSLEFALDGRLTYSIDQGETVQKMNLVYRVEHEEIVTDQPSTPREHRTRFRFDPEGLL